MSPAFEEVLRFDQGRHCDVLKDCGFEEGLSAGISPEFRKPAPDRAIAGKHFGNSSYVAWLAKDISQSGHQSLCGSSVDLRINPIYVTCGTLRAVALRFENEDPMLSARDVRTIKSQTQLDRHIESRNSARQLYPGQIVDGDLMPTAHVAPKSMVEFPLARGGEMEQGSKITIQVPRGVILSWIGVPLLPGFAALINSIDNPGLHGVRGPDLIRIFAIGLCAGVVLCGLVLLTISKKQRS